MTQEKAKPVRRIDNTVYINTDSDGANADWLRAKRLQKKAEQGDEEAAEELEDLYETEMYSESYNPKDIKEAKE